MSRPIHCGIQTESVERAIASHRECLGLGTMQIDANAK